MDKRQAIGLWVFFLIAFILGWIFFFADFFELEYKIILDGEEVREIVKCDDKWNYQNLIEFQEVLFIPCVWNESLKALFNFSFIMSPQENCERFNSTFIGFQVYDDTLAKERYDLVSPKCFEIRNKDINEEWLNEDCECNNHDWKGQSCPRGYKPYVNPQGYVICNAPYKDSACQKYKCSENLEIIKK